MVWLRGIWSFTLGFVGAIALGAVFGTVAVDRQLASVGREPAQVHELKQKPDPICDRFETATAREACRATKH